MKRLVVPDLYATCSRDDAITRAQDAHRHTPARRAHVYTRTLFVAGVRFPVYVVATFARPTVAGALSLSCSTED